jgi:endonuclease YncB( thermonuclease family)
MRVPCLAAVLFLLTVPALAEQITGRVVGIADGDTLTVLDASRHQTKIRLAEIDAPEMHQPYGSRAKQALSNLAFGKDATVDVVNLDRYGRTVGRVHIGALDVNAELVRQGAAWVYPKYNRDPALPLLQEAARVARLGLWALPVTERAPPWEWRKAAAGQRHLTAAE